MPHFDSELNQRRIFSDVLQQKEALPMFPNNLLYKINNS